VALVVDHDPSTAELIALLLRQRRYDARVATTFAQALSIFDAIHPQLLVIDPVLRDGDGLELVRNATPSVRVVVTSAFPTGIERAVAELRVPLVLKPFATDDLMAQVT
jgi:DNA-binding response OmpR family regulator